MDRETANKLGDKLLEQERHSKSASRGGYVETARTARTGSGVGGHFFPVAAAVISTTFALEIGTGSIVAIVLGIGLGMLCARFTAKGTE